MELSHIDRDGRASMVDVSCKPRVRRTARAAGRITMAPETVGLLRKGLLEKGDALAAARLAGIMAGKKAAELIPLCHNIEIDHIGVDVAIDDTGVDIAATAACTDKTGIEMEVLTAVSVAALTLYDMCKAVDKNLVIGDIRLTEKTKESVSTR